MTRPIPILVRLLLLLSAVTAPLAAARAEWREATSKHFIIVSGGSEAQLIRLSQQLEAVHWLLTQVTGASATENSMKVRIFMVDTIRDVRVARGERGNSTVAGFYQPTDEGAIAVVPRDQASFSTTILFHEYAHHFMLQYMPAAFPAWYSEGFAEVMSTASFERDGLVSYGKPANHRAYELLEQSWIPLSRLLNPAGSEVGRQRESFYGQYWLTAHYLTFTPERRGQLNAYINAVNQGQTFDQALTSFAGGVPQLETDLRRYLRGRRFSYRQVPLPVDVMRMPVLRTLRPGETAIIDDELQSYRPMSAADHVPIAARVATLVQRYPADPAVGLLHARLLFYAGELVSAEAALDDVLATDPTNVRALALKGRIMLEGRAASGQTMTPEFVRQARSYIVRANRADPEDPVPLIAYYDSFQLAGERAPDIALDGLYKASRLVPQQPGLRMTVATELIERERLPVARALLAPLALSPHRSSGQAFALHLMQWIDSGGQGEPPPFVPQVEIEAPAD